tara:strand:- start:7167 stop:14003 length:6837 start_codon:yes stop_codon:yes gene_type:complete
MNDDLLDTNNINALLNSEKNEEKIIENTIYDDYVQDIKNDGRKKYKKKIKTAINIDSRNRSIDSKINYISTTILNNNSIITKKGDRKVIIDHQDHNIDFKYNVRISLEDIESNSEDKFNGIPLTLLNFDKNTQSPTYIIYPYENDSYTNRFYYFNLPDDFNVDQIINGTSEKANVKINIISDIQTGYNDTNYYKINLGKKFKNVISVRLISSEIPYVAMTITNTSNEDNNRFRYKKNNKLRWITENESIKVANKVLISDNINNTDSNNISTTLENNIESYYNLYSNDPLSQWNYYSSLNMNSFGINYNNYKKLQKTYNFTQESKNTYSIHTDPSAKVFSGQLENITDQYSKTFNEYIEGYETIDMDIIPLNKDHNSILFYNKIDNVELIKKYPVNEVVLDEGLYNETKLKGMLENKLDQYSVKNYNWNIRDWNVTDFMSSKFFLSESKYSPNKFIVDIDKTLSTISFKQYTDITFNTYDTNILRGNIISNEGYPYLYVVLPGHKLNSGDRIRIDEAVDVGNVSKSNINKEQVIRIGKIFKYTMRLIYPIPKLDYFKNERDLSISNFNATVVYAFFYKIYKNLFPVHSEFTGNILENCMCPINFTNTDDNIYQINAASEHILVDYSGNELDLTEKMDIFYSDTEYLSKVKNMLITNNDTLDSADFNSTFCNTNCQIFTDDGNSNIFSDDLECIFYCNNNETLFDTDGVKNIMNNTGFKFCDVGLNNHFKYLNTSEYNLDSNFTYYGSPLVSRTFNMSQFVYNDTDVDTNYYNFVQCKSTGVDNPFDKYELLTSLKKYKGNDSKKTIGRIVYLDESSNQYGNFDLHIEITSDNMEPFQIGDTLIGLQSNTVAMVVPNIWGKYADIFYMEKYLPTRDIIYGGLLNYYNVLFQLLSYNNNTNYLDNSRMKFLQSEIDRSKSLLSIDTYKYFSSIVTNDDTNKKPLFKLDYKREWPLIKVDNISYGFEIYANKLPFNSQLTGSGGKLMRIYSPLKFKMLFNIDDTPRIEFGFRTLNEKEVKEKETIFKEDNSNLVEKDKVSISKSYLEKSLYNLNKSRLVLECPNKVQFKKNDIIYINDHHIHQSLIDGNKKVLAKIDNIQTFNNYILNFKYRLLLYKSDLPISGTFTDFIHNIQPKINKLVYTIVNNKYDINTDGIHKKNINNIDFVDSYSINYLIKYATQYLGKSPTVIKQQIESNLEEVNKIILNIKKWFYNNIERWCVGDPYKLQSIVDEYKNKKVSKLYLIVKNEKETSNYLKYSFAFKPGMPIIYQNFNDAKYYCLGKVLWSSSDNVLKQQYGKFYIVYIDINDQLEHAVRFGDVFTTFNYNDLLYSDTGELQNYYDISGEVFRNKEFNSSIKDELELIEAQLINKEDNSTFDYLYDSYLSNKCLINYETEFEKSDLENINNHGENVYYNNKFIKNNNILNRCPVDPGKKLYIFDHAMQVNRYSDVDVYDITDTEFNTISGKTEMLDELLKLEKIGKDSVSGDKLKETIGIHDGGMDILANIWGECLDISSNGLLDDYSLGNSVLVDYPWDEDIQKTFFNKGKIRLETPTVDIAGNSGYNYEKYNDDFAIEINNYYIENNLDISGVTINNINIKNDIIGVISNNAKRGDNGIIVNFKDNYYFQTSLGLDNSGNVDNSMNIYENAVSIIDKKLIQKDWISYISTGFTNGDQNTVVNMDSCETHIIGDVYYSNGFNFIDNSNNNINIQELSINTQTKENISTHPISNGDVLIIYNQNLLNNHNIGENFLQKYFMAECDFSGNKITIDNDIYNINNNIFNNDNSYNLVNIIYNQNKDNEMRNLITNWELIGNKIYLDTYIPINNRNNDDNYIVFLNCKNNKFIIENSIENTMTSTQNFYKMENGKKQWYTNIFFNGVDCINPDNDYNVNKEYPDNNSVLSNIVKNYVDENKYKHNYNTGISPFHNAFNDKVYIEGMKGYIYPDIGLLGSDILECQLDIEQEDINDVLYNHYSLDKVSPITNGVYDVVNFKTIDIWDNSGNITGSLANNYYNIPILGHFNNLVCKNKNKKEWIDFNLIRNNNKLLIRQLEDDIQNNIYPKYLNYYHMITIKGKYMGYGGKISHYNNDNLSYLNYSEGFKVVDVKYENNISKICCSINQEYLNINLNIGKDELNYYNNPTPKIPRNLIAEEYIEVGKNGECYTKELKSAFDIKGKDYILMCCPTLGNIQSTSNIKNEHSQSVFAKILLPAQPGKTIFNSFTQSSKEFYNEPLAELNELEFFFIDNEGFLFDFNKRNHSFTIEITEELLFNEKLNTTIGTYAN